MSSAELICEALKQRGYPFVKQVPQISSINLSPLIVVADSQDVSGGTFGIELTVVLVMPSLGCGKQIQSGELHQLLDSVKLGQDQIFESVKSEVEECLHVNLDGGDTRITWTVKTQLAYLDIDGRLLLVDASCGFPGRTTGTDTNSR